MFITDLSQLICGNVHQFCIICECFVSVCVGLKCHFLIDCGLCLINRFKTLVNYKLYILPKTKCSSYLTRCVHKYLWNGWVHFRFIIPGEYFSLQCRCQPLIDFGLYCCYVPILYVPIVSRFHWDESRASISSLVFTITFLYQEI